MASEPAHVVGRAEVALTGRRCLSLSAWADPAGPIVVSVEHGHRRDQGDGILRLGGRLVIPAERITELRHALRKLQRASAAHLLSAGTGADVIQDPVTNGG